MKKKIVNALLLLTLVILVAPTALAKPEYLTILNEVYGNSTCDTCHVNGQSDGPRTPYGMLFENQSDHANNTRAALLAIGSPTAAIPEVTTIPTTPTVTESPVETTAGKTPTTPGFEFVSSIPGLFALALLVRRQN